MFGGKKSKSGVDGGDEKDEKIAALEAQIAELKAQLQAGQVKVGDMEAWALNLYALQENLQKALHVAGSVQGRIVEKLPEQRKVSGHDPTKARQVQAERRRNNQ